VKALVRRPGDVLVKQLRRKSMRELTKSMLSYTWSGPLFLIQQIVNSVTPSDSNGAGVKVSRAYDNVARVTQEQLAELFQVAFHAGDDIQRDMVDLGFRLFGPESWTPSGLARTAADITARVSDGLRYFDPVEGGLAAWREVGNKVRIYRLVKDVKSKLQVPSVRFSLEEFVSRAYDLGPFPALWAVEGLGHDYAATFKPFDDNTAGILTDPILEAVLAKSMTMLHAGIGLAFAEELLKGMDPSSSSDRVRHMLSLFIRLCRENSRLGYEGCALESLGLVTRTWHPGMMTSVNDQLMAIDEAAAAYFWRGAGRALYFLPVNWVPGYGSIMNAIRMSRRDSPHELARRNTLAGIAWASTVVNMQQPSIMEAFLSQHGEELLGQDAFGNGVASSIIMRQDTTPGEPFIKQFIEHQPSGTDKRMEEAWEVHVRTPGRKALDEFYPVLCDKERLGEVFRYQSLSELVAGLRFSKPVEVRATA